MYGWHNRFDDPQREYRTLYCATNRLTCVYEVLADLRPNAAMLAEWAGLFGSGGAAELRPAGVVTWAWRQQNALAEAVVSGGEIADLDDVNMRVELEERHVALLTARGLGHLDVSELRSKDRVVTQSVSRSLYEDGFAGVRFRSNLDDRECFALFEERAWLEGTERQPMRMTDDLPELLQAASDFRLVLERVWTAM
jgi:hypothetical protein